SIARSFVVSLLPATGSAMTARLALLFVCACASVALPLAQAPGQSAPAERWLVASDEPGDRLVLLEARSGTTVATISVGGRPRGMALAADGRRILVALGKDDAVAVVDLASRHVVRRVR